MTHHHTDAELDNYITWQLGEAATALMTHADMSAELHAVLQTANSEPTRGADVIHRD